MSSRFNDGSGYINTGSTGHNKPCAIPETSVDKPMPKRIDWNKPLECKVWGSFKPSRCNHPWFDLKENFNYYPQDNKKYCLSYLNPDGYYVEFTAVEPDGKIMSNGKQVGLVRNKKETIAERNGIKPDVYEVSGVLPPGKRLIVPRTKEEALEMELPETFGKINKKNIFRDVKTSFGQSYTLHHAGVSFHNNFMLLYFDERSDGKFMLKGWKGIKTYGQLRYWLTEEEFEEYIRKENAPAIYINEFDNLLTKGKKPECHHKYDILTESEVAELVDLATRAGIRLSEIRNRNKKWVAAI
jgi:hypothetical protein